MSNQTAITLVGRLEAALDEYEPGYANAEALQTFKSLLKELNESAGDFTNLVAEKVGSIQEWLSILYSPRKHQRHGGVERVKLYIRQDLSSLRAIVERGKK